MDRGFIADKFGHSVKTYTLDQDKVIDPVTTFNNALAKINSFSGILDFHIDESGLDSEWSHQFTFVSADLNTSGKGMTQEQCRASGIMEFIERYSWLNFNYSDYKGYCFSSYQELKNKGLRLPDEEYFLNNYQELADRQELTAKIKGTRLKWITGQHLMDGGDFYYPINWHNYVFGSNGLAAGNSMTEAVVQGICELIERENVYRFLVEKVPGRDIDQSSIKNPMTIRYLEKAAEEGIDFIIKDISSDIGVAWIIVQGVNSKLEGTFMHKGSGQGTHTDPEKALIRALTEYFESLSLHKKTYPIVGHYLDSTLPLFKRHFGFYVNINPDMFDRSAGRISMADMPNIARESFNDELSLILGLLEKKSFDAVFIDKTHPMLDVPALRIFIPQFRNCVNNEIVNPDFFMSVALKEAGDEESSKRYLDRSYDYIADLPYLLANKIWDIEHDFQAFNKSIMRHKKMSAVMFKEMMPNE